VRFTHAARTAAAAFAFSALTSALITPTAAHAVPVAPASQRSAPGDTITLPVRDALAALPVQDESRAGYRNSSAMHRGSPRW